jgi:hypothetical protein
VSRTRCGILHAAPQSRDRTKHRRPLRPRLCSAPLRKGYALRCVRGARLYLALDNWLGAGIATIGGLALRPSTWKPATRL